MTLSVVSFSFFDAQPEVQRPTLLGDGFLYGILSASSPDLNSSGPKGPFGLMWLSLAHLVYNSVRSSTQLAWLLSWQSYIIVQRPLDLWNRMFNRHQTEITVMQFRGHSLLVRQSMSVPWAFFSSSHFISQFPPTRFPFITAIRMCHFLPVHHFEWNFVPGQRPKYNTSICSFNILLSRSSPSFLSLFRKIPSPACKTNVPMAFPLNMANNPLKLY